MKAYLELYIGLNYLYYFGFESVMSVLKLQLQATMATFHQGLKTLYYKVDYALIF